MKAHLDTSCNRRSQLDAIDSSASLNIQAVTRNDSLALLTLTLAEALGFIGSTFHPL